MSREATILLLATLAGMVVGALCLAVGALWDRAQRARRRREYFAQAERAIARVYKPSDLPPADLARAVEQHMHHRRDAA